MNVLFLMPGFDVAGLGIGMKRAFDACAPEWNARAVRLWNNFFNYPADISWDRANVAQTEEVTALWEAADVVHIFEKPDAAQWFPGWQHKPIVVHHLGTYYRLRPGEISAQCRAIGAFEVVDMHDLMRFGIRHPWLPDVIDVTHYAAMRDGWQPGEVVRIAHAPTDRAIKSTAVIEAAVQRLISRGFPIRWDLIERVGNEECNQRKARADIFVDELSMGYGLNALEAWCMGIPDVSANVLTRDLMAAEFGGVIPFVEATPADLEHVLELLVIDQEKRLHWGQIGREHVERYHSQRAVVERAIAFYEQAIGRRRAA